MSLLIQYLVKLSISLAVVWLFYQFILRRLTFYNSNRWFLLGYTVFSFLIPFVNISSFIESKPNDIIRLIPSVHQYTIALEEASHCPVPIWSTNYDKWDFIAFGLFMIAGVLLLRLLIRYFSFLHIRRNARLISDDGVRIFQVDENIIPFSFGNSIFINSRLHTETEWQEIVRHEFVHVRQKHTIDIIWAEILCIINWYNPFAWLLKRSIRQNLEFIADNKVIENGINKKQYQYLLLKVIGNNQFSIATQFNFSSLKKRIAMMNKTKSAKRQLARFLFLLPIVAIILLSFRKSFTAAQPVNDTANVSITDTLPATKFLNSKGYFVDIVDDNGNCTVVVKDKHGKEVKKVLLNEWNAKPHQYESLYGEFAMTVADVGRAVNAIKEKKADITNVTIKGNIATVTLKNGKTETYTLSIKDEKKAFLERCGDKEMAEEVSETESEVTEVIEEPVKTLVESKIATTVSNPVGVTDIKTTLQEAKVATNVNSSINSPNKVSTTVAVSPVEESVTVQPSPLFEARIINLGGLTFVDEGQYILLDGKEVKPEAYDKLKGPYRITFLDKKTAEKKYGEKARQGAIILDTIR